MHTATKSRNCYKKTLRNTTPAVKYGGGSIMLLLQEEPVHFNNQNQNHEQSGNTAATSKDINQDVKAGAQLGPNG